MSVLIVRLVRVGWSGGERRAVSRTDHPIPVTAVRNVWHVREPQWADLRQVIKVDQCANRSADEERLASVSPSETPMARTSQAINDVVPTDLKVVRPQLSILLKGHCDTPRYAHTGCMKRPSRFLWTASPQDSAP
jgi:hypothetical protein